MSTNTGWTRAEEYCRLMDKAITYLDELDINNPISINIFDGWGPTVRIHLTPAEFAHVFEEEWSSATDNKVTVLADEDIQFFVLRNPDF